MKLILLDILCRDLDLFSMNSNYYGCWFLAGVFLVHFAQISQASAKSGICEKLEVNHEILGELTCCEGNAFETTPLQDTAGWRECAGEGLEDSDNYTTTMWRMYTCTLGKLLPKDQKTINLKEFAELRISNFTDSVQKGILAKVKEDVKENSKKSWLSSDVQLTDYHSLDKLRKHYFNIEEDVCGHNGTDLLDPDWQNITAQLANYSACQIEEELLHRGGDCCGNISLPLSIRKFRFSVASNCNRTLKAQYERISLKDKSQEDKQIFGDIALTCYDSCALIEKKLLTVEKLISVQANDTIETDDIVKDQIGAYVSKKLLKSVQKHVKKLLNTAEILEGVKAKWVDKISNPTDLFGCTLYEHISALIHYSVDIPCFDDAYSYSE